MPEQRPSPELVAHVEKISTWIDDPAVAPEAMHADLAARCMKEAASADVLVLYCQPGEVLKGALMEVGAALGAGRQVRCVGDCESVKDLWRKHPNWRNCASLDEAFVQGPPWPQAQCHPRPFRA